MGSQTPQLSFSVHAPASENSYVSADEVSSVEKEETFLVFLPSRVTLAPP